MITFYRIAGIAPGKTASAMGFAVAASLTVLSASVPAQTALGGKATCVAAGANAMEPLGDRDGHGIQVSYGACRVDGGPLDGAAMATSAIWEHDKGAASMLSGDGVIRKPGAMAAYRIAGGNLTFIMKDGKVAGYTASGKGAYTMTTGSASALAGKTFSWTARPTGPGQSVIEWVVD